MSATVPMADNLRILIGPPGDLGVCVQTLALLNVLRSRFPRAVIHWVVEELFAPLVEGHTALDGIIPLPRTWRRYLGLATSFRRLLRDTVSATAYDPCGTTSSAWVLWLSGASQRWGWAAPRGRGWSGWLNNRRIPAGTDGPRTILGMVEEPLGSPLAIRFGVPRNEVAEAVVDGWILAAQLLCGFAVIHVSANHPHDVAWARACGQLARQLGQRRGLTTVVITEQMAASSVQERVLACAGGHALAAPTSDLCQSAALIRRAQLFVARDAGWLQLSAALGRPTLGLCSVPSEEVRPLFGEQLFWFDSQVDESGVGKPIAAETLLDLPSESVFLACAGLLDRHEAPTTRVA